MKHLILLFALALCCACASDSQPATAEASPVNLPEPRRVKVENGKATFVDKNGAPTPNQPTVRQTSSHSGQDLNGDGTPDRLEIVTTTEDNDGLGFKRQLVVVSGEGADLDAWYTADDVILSTEHGGMMGDPFSGAVINNGIIVVDHFGGSRQKWNYTHRFRWQEGDFKLIGTTITFGAPCDAFTTFDYNLSTGKVLWEKETDDCENEDAQPVTAKKNFRKKITLPSMDGFRTGENEIKIPDTEERVFY